MAGFTGGLLGIGKSVEADSGLRARLRNEESSQFSFGKIPVELYSCFQDTDCFRRISFMTGYSLKRW